jgi:hypothetical protein
MDMQSCAGLNFSGAVDETLSITAGETINGGRAVFLSGGLAYKADKDSLTEVKGIFGIAPGAIGNGAVGPVAFTGQLSDSSWTWVSGPIFCGTDGALTQTAPTSGHIRRVAQAMSATTLVISLGEIIDLV